VVRELARPGVFFDLDGTLVREGTALPGARELLLWLEASRIPFAVLTNNSTRHPREVQARLESLGMPVPPGRIVASNTVLAAYAREKGWGERVFVVGEAGLREALEEEGFVLVEEDADFVAVGLARSATYADLGRAYALIERGAIFAATNRDRRFPREDGSFSPGSGAILAFLEASTGVEALVVGKPHEPMYHVALRAMGGECRPCVLVGDNLITDGLFGRRFGMRTYIVGTGVTPPSALAGLPASLHPAEDLWAVRRDLEAFLAAL